MKGIKKFLKAEVSQAEILFFSLIVGASILIGGAMDRKTIEDLFVKEREMEQQILKTMKERWKKEDQTRDDMWERIERLEEKVGE